MLKFLCVCFLVLLYSCRPATFLAEFSFPMFVSGKKHHSSVVVCQLIKRCKDQSLFPIQERLNFCSKPPLSYFRHEIKYEFNMILIFTWIPRNLWNSGTSHFNKLPEVHLSHYLSSQQLKPGLISRCCQVYIACGAFYKVKDHETIRNRT